MLKITKTRTLFNKNHITLVVSELDKPVNGISRGVSYNIVNSKYVHKKDYGTTDVSTKKEVRCKSPLGFYYTKTVYERPEYTNSYINNEMVEVKISYGCCYYILTYMKSFDGVSVNEETRPWNIVKGDKGISDHMVKALYNEVDKLFTIIKDEKLKISEGEKSCNSMSRDFHWLKTRVYKELFGDKDGLKFQTDSDKILSHGFDLKTSFRKM